MANKPYSRTGYKASAYRSVTYSPAQYTETGYAQTEYTGGDYDSGADAKDNLTGKINLKDAAVAVLGLRNGGLQLATAFAEAGFATTGIDPSGATLEMLSRHQSPVSDVSNDALAHAMNAGLTFCERCDALPHADCIVIALPSSDSSDQMPPHPKQDSSTALFIEIIEQIKPLLKKEMLIVLETDTFPGMTAELFASHIYSNVGLKTGQDIFVAFSAKQNTTVQSSDGVRRSPKTVGGVTPLCAELAATLYRRVFDQVKTHSIIPAPPTAEESAP